MDVRVIDRFEQGAGQLRQSIAGLSHDELNAVPVFGTWSIRQIVFHLMDSDLIGADRMKRIIAEDRPLLIGFNETRFADRLPYAPGDVDAACTVFELNRRLTTTLLRGLSEDASERTGVHSERGTVTLGQLVGDYANHLEHHLRFIHGKRRLIGNPLG